MKQICIFGGTTEGRLLTQFLAQFQDIRVTVSLATPYGKEILQEDGFEQFTNVSLRVGRMDFSEMTTFLPSFHLVVDCTHPYAQAVTQQIQEATANTGTPCLRVLRPTGGAEGENIIFLEHFHQIITFLTETNGNILSTLGSKELHHFQGENFLDRLYARVLPVADSIQACQEIGLPSSRIIAMQGPFSFDMNGAMIREKNIQVMITKDSGKVGGMDEKVRISKELGVKLIVWKKSEEGETGLTLEETKEEICKKFGLIQPRKLQVISCGMGGAEGLTLVGKRALESAKVVFGTKRLLEQFTQSNKKTFVGYKAEEIQHFWENNPQSDQVVLLVTGDCGFYSAGKDLRQKLPGAVVEYLPGISSPVYLAAKLQMPWEDSHFLSLHGKNHSILPETLKYHKTFFLFGGENSPQNLCRLLIEYDLNLSLAIGEDLGSPSEKITTGTAKELVNQEFSPLSCGFLFNPNPNLGEKWGLAEEEFIRVENVPMTKSEVRAVVLSKLKITPEAKIYDIGAGSGSVTVEMALQATRGVVYALEKKPEAVELLKRNKKAFFAENVEIRSGDALESLGELPPPTHVFIGGFSGNTADLVKKILEKSPNTRFVATTVTLETLAELTPILKEFSYHQVVEISVSCGEKRGKYHMMLANNPVFVITFQNILP